MIAPPTQDVPSTLRQVRLSNGCLLLAIFLYAVMAERLVPPRTQPLDATTFIGMSAAALMVLGVALYFHIRVVRGAAQVLRGNPTDQSMIARWRLGLIIFATLCEAIALFGFALHYLGASRVETLPFYGVGAGLIILCRPKQP
jgi:F0F1-type ATP synthase membrane subunit c/vacuolar-type H+-ATPase subunit K